MQKMWQEVYPEIKSKNTWKICSWRKETYLQDMCKSIYRERRSKITWRICSLRTKTCDDKFSQFQTILIPSWTATKCCFKLNIWVISVDIDHIQIKVKIFLISLYSLLHLMQLVGIHLSHILFFSSSSSPFSRASPEVSTLWNLWMCSV